LAHQGITGEILPPWTHYLVGYGPALAALAVCTATEGASGLRRLGGRLLRWRASGGWWLAAVSPFLVGAATLGLVNLWRAGGVGLAELGSVPFLPRLGLAALPLWLVTFGLGEETGWRGFALPRLQAHHSALRASVILAAIWAGWHLPLFFYDLAPGMAAFWLVSLFAAAILLTWLFNGSGGSVMLPVAFHGTFNFVTSSTTAPQLVPAVVSTAVILGAVLVMRRFGPADLAPVKRTRI
jgi:membrane protease YdiL (CAAX protease family)